MSPRPNGAKNASILLVQLTQLQIMHRTHSFLKVGSIALVASITPLSLHAQCDAPTASVTTTIGDPATICLGSALVANGSASSPAPGHTITSWIWQSSDGTTMTTPTSVAAFTFDVGGVQFVTLQVVDESGCMSLIPDTLAVLVSPTPDFSESIVPDLVCGSAPVTVVAHAVQGPMLLAASACSPLENGVPLVDNSSIVSTSLLEVSGQANAMITDPTQLGDICLDIEHSYMGDLILTVSCPNGQSVILHQQGGGGTFLGDANDSDGGTIVPGTCFTYCFGPDPEFGTLVQSIASGPFPNVVATSQGTAIAAGRYTPVQPLTQLLGCPTNGTWTFSSQDLFGADNGYLCGWCITFDGGADSSYYGLGPRLGSSADSSYWSGPGISNDPAQPGTATLAGTVGTNNLSYTVIDSYGCVHEASFAVEVGETPDPLIYENPDLGLICVQVDGSPVIQWYYNGVLVSGAAGTCFTPPGNGLVSVTATSAEGCVGNDTFIPTSIAGEDLTAGISFRIYPVPNTGSFTIAMEGATEQNMILRILDMTGRTVHQQRAVPTQGAGLVVVHSNIASGAYLLELSSAGLRSTQRIVVQ